ncbi:nicotinate phosphoribosyltransferase [Mycoplasma crocodyli]|uniref:nicotinate phosphoribosyltransferase n=1 Tax=Mycoplasma crocodyli (strain ATCC 51981 / MP145) TaxID=512564 RepID=D5E5M9_MYCCM|nr:nicotinate phosphoribosyltransferase [Mycoplasma crocodyli]ADE19756.1 nicotinate phosphoribosyltransferase [Mycoplasma crocodyli MP145]
MNREKYIASYFFKASKILEEEKKDNIITLQFFQRKDNAILAGMSEVLELLSHETNTSKYTIRYLPDGTLINNLEIVLELEGKYQDFGIWEGVIDGILSRSTSIASNARDCVLAANNKPIIFMGDRADHYLNQEVDGKAVKIGGINLVSTEAQNIDNNEVTFGSVPHVLIQGFAGDIVAAMKAYYKHFPNNKLIALVDYTNDVITESLRVWKELGNHVWGIRLDTSKNMVDHMFDNEPQKHYGVNLEQVKRLRKELDKAGARDYKIVVSSGFNAEKIKEFEANKSPVDYYGVGQSIFKLTNSFSADATLLNGKKEAKEGRFYRENKNLILYKNKK